jgi:hypothetical protein
MADITVTFSDGSTHTYENVPNNVTREQAIQRAQKDFSGKSVQDVSRASFAEMSLPQVAQTAVSNIPASAGRMAQDIYQAVTNPVQTAKTVLDIGAGTLQNILPESLVQMIGPDVQSRNVASQVGEFYKQRYGSQEGVKKAIATDPVGVMADLSTILTGGAAVAPKVAAPSLRTAASMVDPISIASRAVGKTVGVAGSAIPPALGMSTGVGAEPIRQAFQAGVEGGERGRMFTTNMRGTADMMDILDVAKQNLDQIRIDRGNAYKANMANIKGDKTILNFSGIDKAIKEAFDKVSFKGQIKNQDAAAKLSEAQAIVNNWKQLNPAEFHTPEGIDALKQSVGQILEGLQPRTTSDTVVKGVYNSIKNEINKQAPTYAKTMKSYSESTDLIREIERSLSLNDKASADTAMRKLQSLMRNNVNTNYGQRLKLAQELELAGGRQMMPSLAGQALNELTPRGLQRASTIPTALLAGASGGLPAAAASMIASSPRAMGEVAYGAGVGTRGLLDVQRRIPNIDYPTMFNLLYQSQQPKD